MNEHANTVFMVVVFAGFAVFVFVYLLWRHGVKQDRELARRRYDDENDRQQANLYVVAKRLEAEKVRAEQRHRGPRG
jgi:hypothetical protein